MVGVASADSAGCMICSVEGRRAFSVARREELLAGRATSPTRIAPNHWNKYQAQLLSLLPTPFLRVQAWRGTSKAKEIRS